MIIYVFVSFHLGYSDSFSLALANLLLLISGKFRVLQQGSSQNQTERQTSHQFYLLYIGYIVKFRIYFKLLISFFRAPNGQLHFQ